MSDWRQARPRPHVSRSLWRGETALAGKTVLLHGEQGLGATVQFCRYARCLADRGARVVLEVCAPWLGVLASVDPRVEVTERGCRSATFDLHYRLADLPAAFAAGPDNIPYAGGYLRADPLKTADWAERLGSEHRPLVGLAWGAGLPGMALADVLAALPAEVAYVDVLAAEDCGGGRELGDTAALCRLADLVICADADTAHLSAALGRPTWWLLPRTADWRWALHADKSPWYSSLTLYRQGADGDWMRVLADMSKRLRLLATVAATDGSFAGRLAAFGLGGYDCPVCGGHAGVYDAVDFNKSCAEAWGRFLPSSGVAVVYALCSDCRHCFAPALLTSAGHESAFALHRRGYIAPDSSSVRWLPKIDAEVLMGFFDGRFAGRHLDYGGNGLLSGTLREAGWRSRSYMSLAIQPRALRQLGCFDLVTAARVFERSPDPHDLLRALSGLLVPDGVLLVSTMLSDGGIVPNGRLVWWYAAPRNGHINLFSAASLRLLAEKHGFQVAVVGEGMYAFFKAVPAWARTLLGGRPSLSSESE